MRNYFSLSLLIILVLVFSGCLNSLPTPSPDPTPTPPPHEQKSTLTGVVQDSLSGLELWNGTVTIAGQSTQIKNGSFVIENLARGTYTLIINKPFYKPLQKQVLINKANITISEKLTPIFGLSELDLLARLVYAEAKGEIYQGQVAVAATVLNRLKHPDYPNTLSDVINQVVVSGGRRYYQYEPVLNGSISMRASQTAINAVSDALVGWDPSLNATGFFAPSKVGSNSWVWSRTSTVTIGNHRFFR